MKTWVVRRVPRKIHFRETFEPARYPTEGSRLTTTLAGRSANMRGKCTHLLNLGAEILEARVQKVSEHEVLLIR